MRKWYNDFMEDNVRKVFEGLNNVWVFIEVTGSTD